MAFVSASAPFLQSSTWNRRRATHALNRKYLVGMTATSSDAHSAPRYQIPIDKASTIRPHRSATVVDSRIASAIEAHHWIVVKSHGRRMFERAAVAQTDMTRQVEKRAGEGALHRWVLRQVSDPIATFTDTCFEANDARYVVMETFKAAVSRDSPGVMRRWLSAVEKVGPLMDTVDIRTRHYENVFTAKLHDVQFDPNVNIVVMESINVDMSDDDNVQHVLDILTSTAESSVSAGNCVEFCVLQPSGKNGFFKTIEVYRDVDALLAHMNSMDKTFVQRIYDRTTRATRSRQTFRPVVFS